MTTARHLPLGLVACAIVSALLVACDRGPSVTPDDDLRVMFGLAALGSTPYPEDNPQNPDRIALGQLLFFDPVLSGEKDVSCGTCHHPNFAFADGRQFGAGVSGAGLGPERTLSRSSRSGRSIPPLARNVITVLNAALAREEGLVSDTARLLWDGRVRGLERLTPRPLRVREEMRGDAFPGDEFAAQAVTLDSILGRLREIPDYVQRFSGAFSEELETEGGAPSPSVIDSSTYGRALAAYMRELVSRNSAYDQYVDGQDDALTIAQKRGLILFHGKAGCVACHGGPMFSDFARRRIGVPHAGVGGTMIPGDDLGLTEDTRDPQDRFLFRTPSLRNVALTAPYMHNGVFGTLEEVIAFFNAGGQPRHRRMTDELIDPAIAPLGLTRAEMRDLVSFLHSLSDPGSEIDEVLLTIPARVPSGLTPIFGVGSPTAH